MKFIFIGGSDHVPYIYACVFSLHEFFRGIVFVDV